MHTALPDQTPVFESYWRFAAERQRVWERRFGGTDTALTDDPIIANYRFTNSYRVLDRVTQYLLTNVVYDSHRSSRDTLLRILLFKIFNKIETWDLLTAEFGPLGASTFDVAAFNRLLSSVRADGGRIYSNAYITPPIRGVEGPKHLGHLLWLRRVLVDDLDDELASASSLSEIYERLARYDGFGPFLAYQLAVDIAYSPLTTVTEDDFMVAGPGAIDGVTKCFPTAHKRDVSQIIYTVCAEQASWFEHFGIDFPYLQGRHLRPIDCQNLFCEISKYARVAHPGVAGSLGRTQIKQSYRPSHAPMPELFLPPKWNSTGPQRALAEDRVGAKGLAQQGMVIGGWQ